MFGSTFSLCSKLFEQVLECLWSEQWKWLIPVVGIESDSTRVQYTGWILCFFSVFEDIRPNMIYGSFQRTLHHFCSGIKVIILLYGAFFFFFDFGPTAPSGPEPTHSRGFSITHNKAPQSVRLLWTSDQLVAETSTQQHTTNTTDRYQCPPFPPPVGYEPTISADERPQNYALVRAVLRTGMMP